MRFSALSPDSSKQHLWASRMAEFAQFKGSVAQFCRAHNCSVASFYQWKRKLNVTTRSDSKRSSAVASEAIPRGNANAFLRIETSPPQATAVQIKLADDGITVLVPMNAIDSLHTIIAQLKSSCLR